MFNDINDAKWGDICERAMAFSLFDGDFSGVWSFLGDCVVWQFAWELEGRDAQKTGQVAPRRPLEGPRRVQDGSKAVHDGRRSAQDDPKTVARGLKTPASCFQHGPKTGYYGKMTATSPQDANLSSTWA